MNRWALPLGIVALVSVGLAGCGDMFSKLDWGSAGKKKSVPLVAESSEVGLTASLAYRDTVAEQGWCEGLRLMRVRGYGLVAGLGTRGSRECPRVIRDRLIQEMNKLPVFGRQGLKPAPITPEKLIDDPDTAVVVIEGDIPAAAAKGATFDVTVRALPGTQTTSLEGGRLYTAELHLFQENEPGAWIEGKVLAKAEGPVFINPFGGEADSVTRPNPREGQIIGGGHALETRRVRFVLSQPSYQRAQAISTCINGRFPGNPKVADAQTPSHVAINIPPTHRDDPFRFLALLRHLYLPRTPGFLDQRAQDLAKEIVGESAPHADIALAWEGIGRPVLPVVEKLYTDSRPHVAFYAALTGLRLGDDVAVEVIDSVACSAQSPYRLTAIEELGYARNSARAAGVLRRLLDDPDPRIRVEAYEALLFRQDTVIESRPVGSGFTLDLVPSTAPNLIYVRRTGAPRIALLGSGLRCAPPLFYRHPEGLLTLNAEDGDKQLTLIRKTRFADRYSPPLPAPLEVEELVTMLGDDPVVSADGAVHGVALEYSTVTHVLHELCRLNCMNSRFLLQAPSVTELFGPLDSGGRPESEL